MRVNGVPHRTVWLEGSTVRMIDQTLIPLEFKLVDLPTVEDTAWSIKTMVVRGAGAIGATGAYGAHGFSANGRRELDREVARLTALTKEQV